MLKQLHFIIPEIKITRMFPFKYLRIISFLVLMPKLLFSQVNIDTLPRILLALDDSVALYVDEALAVESTFTELEENGVIWLNVIDQQGYWDKNYRFCTKADTLSLKTDNQEKVLLFRITNGLDSTFAGVNFYSLKPTFSTKHINRHRGQVFFEVPPVFELVNIALSLTEKGQEDFNMIEHELSYYEEVQKYFQAYKDHPLIQFLNEEMEDQEDYLSIYLKYRDYSIALSFDGEKAINNGEYPKPYRFNPWFGEAFKLLNDFARDADFVRFYQKNKGYYGKVRHEQAQFMPVMNMWNWLESLFPGRFDGFRVIFSPLVSGAHSFRSFEMTNYKEGVMFVNAADLTLEENNTNAEKEGYRSGIIFTEIDHGYVDQVTDEYTDQIAPIFVNRDKWVSPGGDAKWYATPNLVFNEYMTHALYLVWARERYEDVVFQKIRRSRESLMLGRRFIRFKSFYEALQTIFEAQKEGIDIEEVYPAIISWAAEQ